jgi:hypothetical protein
MINIENNKRSIDFKNNNRCVAFNINNRRCRAKLDENKLFCCKNHEPINNEIIENCFLCMDKIEKTKDILFFKCKHAFHKPCYEEWLKFSTYENPICIICRNENITYECYMKNKKNNTKQTILKKISNEDLCKIKNILNILYN